MLAEISSIYRYQGSDVPRQLDIQASQQARCPPTHEWVQPWPLRGHACPDGQRFDSKHVEVLSDIEARRADLDFLLPQFYNGVTRPMTDGVGGTGAGAMSAGALFSSLANNLFDQQPNKVSSTFNPQSSAISMKPSN